MYEFTIYGTFNENVNDVYNAFYKPDTVIRWLAPNALRANSFISDFTEGGHYRVLMQDREAYQQSIMGIYNTIEYDKKLSFTWRWDDSDELSRVSITFSKNANQTTTIKLTQSGFRDEQSMLQEQYGWLSSLEKLTLAMRELNTVNQTLKCYP